jgi:hypothetical protein
MQSRKLDVERKSTGDRVSYSLDIYIDLQWLARAAKIKLVSVSVSEAPPGFQVTRGVKT